MGKWEKLFGKPLVMLRVLKTEQALERMRKLLLVSSGS